MTLTCTEKLSPIEWYKISNKIKSYHNLFSALWDIKTPVLVDNNHYVKTLAVSKENEESSILMINKEFWNSCDDYQKLFYVCHELLHVIYDHSSYLQIKNIKQVEANTAMDIFVNHALCESYGFSRALLTLEEKLCWVDTVFSEKDAEVIPTDLSWIEYYKLILSKQTNQEQETVGNEQDPNQEPETPECTCTDIVRYEPCTDIVRYEGSADSESSQDKSEEGSANEEPSDEDGSVEAEDMFFMSSPEYSNDIKKVIEKFFDCTTPGQEIGCSLQESMPTIKDMKDIEYVPKKKSWEQVVKKLLKKAEKETFKDQWVYESKRITSLPKGIACPSIGKTTARTRHKVSVALFLDTSGSCASLAERFFKCLKSIPLERFDVEAFCFDTDVYPIDLKDPKLAGFGGTSFACIESILCSKDKYPDVVFVITDGEAGYVNVSKPKNWNWFLSCDIEQPSNLRAIPKTCNIYDLSKFE